MRKMFLCFFVLSILVFGAACTGEVEKSLVHSGVLKEVKITTKGSWLYGHFDVAAVMFEDGFLVTILPPPDFYHIGGKYEIYKESRMFGSHYSLVSKDE